MAITYLRTLASWSATLQTKHSFLTWEGVKTQTLYTFHVCATESLGQSTLMHLFLKTSPDLFIFLRPPESKVSTMTWIKWLDHFSWDWLNVISISWESGIWERKSLGFDSRTLSYPGSYAIRPLLGGMDKKSRNRTVLTFFLLSPSVSFLVEQSYGFLLLSIPFFLPSPFLSFPLPCLFS